MRTLSLGLLSLVIIAGCHHADGQACNERGLARVAADAPFAVMKAAAQYRKACDEGNADGCLQGG